MVIFLFYLVVYLFVHSFIHLKSLLLRVVEMYPFFSFLPIASLHPIPTPILALCHLIVCMHKHSLLKLFLTTPFPLRFPRIYLGQPYRIFLWKYNIECCQMTVEKKAVSLEVFSLNGFSSENLLFLAFIQELQALVPPLLGALGICLIMQHPWIDMNTISSMNAKLTWAMRENCINMCFSRA